MCASSGSPKLFIWVSVLLFLTASVNVFYPFHTIYVELDKQFIHLLCLINSLGGNVFGSALPLTSNPLYCASH